MLEKEPDENQVSHVTPGLQPAQSHSNHPPAIGRHGGSRAGVDRIRDLLEPLGDSAQCAPLTWDYLRLMSTPNHRRHFGALGATASGIKVSSGGRELLSGIDSGTTLSLGGSPIHVMSPSPAAPRCLVPSFCSIGTILPFSNRRH
jgi:hypothetical protein